MKEPETVLIPSSLDVSERLSDTEVLQLVSDRLERFLGHVEARAEKTQGGADAGQ